MRLRAFPQYIWLSRANLTGRFLNQLRGYGRAWPNGIGIRSMAAQIGATATWDDLLLTPATSTWDITRKRVKISYLPRILSLYSTEKISQVFFVFLYSFLIPP